MNKSIIASLIAATAAHMALAEPLALSCTTLIEDFDFTGIASYKCKTAVKDFEEAIMAANAHAETNRANIAAVRVSILKNAWRRPKPPATLARCLP